MAAPDKIYLKPLLMEDGESIVRKCSEEYKEGYTIEYIRKDALLEKVDEILNAKPDDGLAVDIAAQAFIDIKKVINSI